MATHWPTGLWLQIDSEEMVTVIKGAGKTTNTEPVYGPQVAVDVEGWKKLEDRLDSLWAEAGAPVYCISRRPNER